MNRVTKVQLDNMCEAVNTCFEKSAVIVAGRYNYTALDLGWKHSSSIQSTIATCLTKRQAYEILDAMLKMAQLLEGDKAVVK